MLRAKIRKVLVSSDAKENEIVKKGKSGEFTALGNFGQVETGGEDLLRSSEALPDDGRVVMASPEADESAVMVAPGIVPLDEIPDSNGSAAVAEVDESGRAESAEDSGDNESIISAPFPLQILSGAAGEFARLYSSYMEPPIEFFFMSFLTCLGSVLADRLTLKSEIKPQPRLYTLLLGESADERKSTAIKKTVEFFEEFFIGSIADFLSQDYFNVCWGVGSAEGLQKVLEEANKTLLGIDELKAFVGKCKGQGSVLLPCVNTLFESNEYDNRTKTTNVILRGVYLSILAASTIPTYERTWDSSFIDIGFTNRLFIVPARGQKRFSIPRLIPSQKKTLVRYLLDGVMRLVDERYEVPISEGAQDKFDQWYKSLERSVHTKRLDAYALRIMPLLAVNDFKTEIDEETVDKVIALMNWQLSVRRQYDPIDADTFVARLEEKIRRTLRSRGPLSERDLRRFTNADKVGIWAFKMALRNLAVAKDIVIDVKEKLWKLNTVDDAVD